MSPTSCESQLSVYLTTQGESEKGMFSWFQNGSLYVKGYIYGDEGIITDQGLIDYFYGSASLSSLTEKIEGANGYFAVIISTPTTIFAAVDRVSSTHLFYRVSSVIEIGDSYKGFVSRSSSINPDAIKSYLASGYVHGEETLLENTFQIPAGSILRVEKDSGDVKINKYFCYLTAISVRQKSQKDLLNELHETHLQVFERMVRSLNGRQAIVPLSGGYDSRLIIEMLARFNHKNVLCVTWGAEDYWQVKVARETAKYMGMDWLRVENTSDQWREWYESGALDIEIAASGPLSTIPYVQDNVLIKNLKDTQRVDSDAIFISGNSGDFVEGGHISRIYANDEVQSLLHTITSTHMRLHQLQQADGVTELIYQEILSYRDVYDDINGFDEYWEWKERQSKFVTKCVKAFEVQGFEWRMPFWDLELMEFWKSVPREMKLERGLFYEYASKYMSTRSPGANPRIPFIKRYSDALTDGRYGCFKPSKGVFSGIFTSSKQICSVDLGETIVYKPIAVTRINGLIALHVVCSIINECNSRASR